MRELIMGESISGDYYVRPVTWAGIWDRTGKLKSGDVLFSSPSKYECKNYIIRQKLFDLIEDNPTFKIIPIINESVETTSLFGHTKKEIVKVELDSYYTYLNTVYLQSEVTADKIIMDRELINHKESSDDLDSQPLIIWKECIVVYIE